MVLGSFGVGPQASAPGKVPLRGQVDEVPTSSAPLANEFGVRAAGGVYSLHECRADWRPEACGQRRQSVAGTLRRQPQGELPRPGRRGRAGAGSRSMPGAPMELQGQGAAIRHMGPRRRTSTAPSAWARTRCASARSTPTASRWPASSALEADATRECQRDGSRARTTSCGRGWRGSKRCSTSSEDADVPTIRAHRSPLRGCGLIASTAEAQSLGTFRWQLQPFCNVVTVNVTQQGAVYTAGRLRRPVRRPAAGAAGGPGHAEPRRHDRSRAERRDRARRAGRPDRRARSRWPRWAARGPTAPATAARSPSARARAEARGRLRPQSEEEGRPSRRRLRCSQTAGSWLAARSTSAPSRRRAPARG